MNTDLYKSLDPICFSPSISSSRSTIAVAIKLQQTLMYKKNRYHVGSSDLWRPCQRFVSSLQTVWSTGSTASIFSGGLVFADGREMGCPANLVPVVPPLLCFLYFFFLLLDDEPDGLSICKTRFEVVAKEYGIQLQTQMVYRSVMVEAVANPDGIRRR
ncbi:hypothetical protein L6452_33059 [Arctium lappa]|uniref:Uncharacterized protein n=1 Tax=Arctium lappa TaxID=4217 RepID=A0ACB8Z624_ARCLA|nr:hypothetical protein L6452_33059 [Arctium lappa]